MEYFILEEKQEYNQYFVTIEILDGPRKINTESISFVDVDMNNAEVKSAEIMKYIENKYGETNIFN